MSLFSDFKAIQSFGNALLNNRGYTFTLLKLNQERANAIINASFDTLQVIKDNNPFEDCMNLMQTQDLQRRFLNKAMHPDLIEQGEELIQEWKTTNVEMTKGNKKLALTIMFVNDEFPTYFEVSGEIEQFEWNKLGHYDYVKSTTSIKEAFNKEEEVKPTVSLKELPFSFSRKDG